MHLATWFNLTGKLCADPAAYNGKSGFRLAVCLPTTCFHLALWHVPDSPLVFTDHSYYLRGHAGVTSEPLMILLITRKRVRIRDDWYGNEFVDSGRGRHISAVCLTFKNTMFLSQEPMIASFSVIILVQFCLQCKHLTFTDIACHCVVGPILLFCKTCKCV